MQPYVSSNLEAITLGQTIHALKNEYKNVLEFEITNANAVKASVITKTGKNETIYVNPISGKKIGTIEKASPFFNWVTNFHRSLFLKSIGRFFVGLVSLLLCLIAITGVVLILKRQGGLLKFFSKVKETNFNERYHVILGRWFLIPICIIAFTGVYLSAEKFSLLPETSLSHNYDLESSEKPKYNNILEFPLLKNITLHQLRRLTFPFSDDPQDYFEIALRNKEILLHQYTGEVVSEIPYPFVQMASILSLKLHTGEGSLLWAISLLITSISILFFIYSGLSMSLKRLKKSRVDLGTFDKDESEIILLVGSETGNTFVFAKAFCKALLKAGKKVFLSSLNDYSTYKNAKQLVVFTSTYGEGDAPNNARNFETLFNTVKPLNPLQFSVVGFGSKLYPNYCYFAIKTDALLHKLIGFKPVLPLMKINEQSQSAFETWVSQWSGQTNINLNLKSTNQKKKLYKFEVLERTPLNRDDTFLLKLKPKKTLNIKSGDLLSITPENDSKARLYSVGKIKSTIVLSIKKHNKGVCSSQLSQLKQNDMVSAEIQQNTAFHYPHEAKEVIMISNGTGIAPFLGMINNKNTNNTKTYLFWGGRTKESFKLYSDLIDAAFYKQNLPGLFVSFSKAESQRKYVQNSLVEKKDLVCRVLKNGGVLMICGSLAMRNDVLETLDGLSKQNLGRSISEFESNNQILTDCY
ncbi:PepSY domain-containing protein [Flavobacteriaceae bacterium MHTCC 0001]